MPIRESSRYPREKLEELRKRNVCGVCGQSLWLYLDAKTHQTYLSCSNQSHEGIVREFQSARELNIKAQREELEKTMTTTKASALAKYVGNRELARNEAKEIVESMFPDAPEVEREKAILECVSYRLNPLNGHIFLIAYNKGKENETWARVMGIKAKRLLANRPVPGTKEPRPFSYVDDTPRIMTPDEQIKIFGAVKTDKLVIIVKTMDPKTGAVAPGYGEWPLTKRQWSKDKGVYIDVANEPYGVEKGNSMFNMAAIHAESQSLDRLRPGEMPENVETVDERTIEGEYRVVDEKTGEVHDSAGHPIVGESQEREDREETGSTTPIEPDITWDDLKSASPKEEPKQPPAPDEPWEYKKVSSAIVALRAKKVKQLLGQDFAERMNKDFKVDLPAGTQPNLKTVYELLSREKKREFCFWIADLQAMSQ